MYILYDVVFLIFAAVYLPYLIFTRRYHSRLIERFGIFGKAFLSSLKDKHLIWLHAVSVGEVIAASSFIKDFHKNFPGYKLLISTVTKTGNKTAEGIKKEEDILIYFPLDLSFIVRSMIRRIRPRVFVIMETEIWPNIITAFNKEGIPVVVINGRLSARSFGMYRRVRFLMKNVFDKVDLFCMQTDSDAGRLAKIGVRQNRIKVTGNMKYDAADAPADENRKNELRRILGISGSQRILIAGSTHPGEDEVIIAAYKDLLAEFPQLRLIVAPRHIERAGEVALIGERNGLLCGRFSSLEPVKSEAKIIILDVLGKLRELYSVSDIVFMGGSLFPRYGGHNLLEPAAVKKPILFGPHMTNFRNMADEFLRKKAAIRVSSKEDIKEACRSLIINPEHARRLGELAYGILEKNKGATEKNISYIKTLVWNQ